VWRVQFMHKGDGAPQGAAAGREACRWCGHASRIPPPGTELRCPDVEAPPPRSVWMTKRRGYSPGASQVQRSGGAGGLDRTSHRTFRLGERTFVAVKMGRTRTGGPPRRLTRTRVCRVL
jgi:hypothetical protein